MTILISCSEAWSPISVVAFGGDVKERARAGRVEAGSSVFSDGLLKGKANRTATSADGPVIPRRGRE